MENISHILPPKRLGLDKPIVRLNLLGGFALTSPNGETIQMPTRKNRMMLGILAESNKLHCTRDRLCSLLWGEHRDDLARSSLRQSLAVLRKELGEYADSIMETNHETVGLCPDALSCDTHEFLKNSKTTSVQELRDATLLYQGEFLNDIGHTNPIFEEWLASERRHFSDNAIIAFEKLALLESGQAAISAAKRLVELDPLRENSHRVLMNAYANFDENGMALRQYENCRNLLIKELGIEPAQKTKDLKDRIAHHCEIRSP
jgi:DNA-binding SARP family transcriptional activator